MRRDRKQLAFLSYSEAIIRSMLYYFGASKYIELSQIEQKRKREKEKKKKGKRKKEKGGIG